MAEAMREMAAAIVQKIVRLGDRNGKRNGSGSRVHTENGKPTQVQGNACGNRGRQLVSRDREVVESTASTRGTFVEFATYMLEGEAEHWWYGVQMLWRQDTREIFWEDFKEEFYMEYFPKSVCETKEMKLMQLSEGNMSIAEYTRKFKDLCHF
ncbi:uncharacterized protein LOC107627315 [Arachis ipaensis]|uniref:uncharacterized protein LOC107627315 n=1 Tax=Arachis ipaensis TaxID=130454 RepID=UPI0007AF39A0|nr:uncharacterized protein LOC107627315 [Arachis ipaensis]